MILALLVMIVGAIVWIFVEGQKLAELGRVMFTIGLFWAVYLGLGLAINFRG